MSNTDVLLTIGSFSKMTYLSVKALRHYHDVGLLEPADVDLASGYRRYSTAQVGRAQAIRRFRALNMSIDDIRAVLDARDTATRNAAIVAHLDRMQQQLEQTQETVASLRSLLDIERARIATVVDRLLPPLRALAVRDRIAFDEAGDWCHAAFAELAAQLDARSLDRSGPDAALYYDDFFEEGLGSVMAIVPIATRVPVVAGRADFVELESTRVAVLVHEGPFSELDRTYGALGTVVAARGVGAAGPIREHYLDEQTTEVCWPIQPRVDGGGSH
jgi:DNA-binding transcriptional MerR regulator